MHVPLVSIIITLTMICPRVFLCIKHDKIFFILNYFHCKLSPPAFLWRAVCPISEDSRLWRLFLPTSITLLFATNITHHTSYNTHTQKHISRYSHFDTGWILIPVSSYSLRELVGTVNRYISTQWRGANNLFWFYIIYIIYILYPLSWGIDIKVLLED